MAGAVKSETNESLEEPGTTEPREGLVNAMPVIDLSSSDSVSSHSDGSSDNSPKGKRPGSSEGSSIKKQKLDIILPLGFLDPLPTEVTLSLPAVSRMPPGVLQCPEPRNFTGSCKQFWKAGDYEGHASGDSDYCSGGMDHVRVHPKFLHSNATSHKWAMGAFAELLDNSLDEICNGATYVCVDMLKNKKDGSKMLLVEDNGGGMDPDKMRHCISLGYSMKSKLGNTIGQYGNGFKTSTMRLGADVIVFSRFQTQEGRSSTQSVGLLSYTFLRMTKKEDIVVPMLDYERQGREWIKMMRGSSADTDKNLETILQWSPFSCEADLFHELNLLKDHGTRIIIYSLWEDDEGQLELDFDADEYDIQARGVNRDEKNIEMAKKCPNSRHFLTYRHSLRSYASILYLRLPSEFRIILRGRDVEHHNIVNDMMLTQEVTYRPQYAADSLVADSNMVAVVTIGFVKDARFHFDVQGFNVYHKNRLIKPFWRVWNPAGSDGRGVIGVLEANFVEPAHDKQGFERTTVLSRLESRLIQMQKSYWLSNCHKIGYAPRISKKKLKESGIKDTFAPAIGGSGTKPTFDADKVGSQSFGKLPGKESRPSLGILDSGEVNPCYKGVNELVREVEDSDVREPLSVQSTRRTIAKLSPIQSKILEAVNDYMPEEPTQGEKMQHQSVGSDADILFPIRKLEQENKDLKDRLNKKENEAYDDVLGDLQREREKCKSLESQLDEAMRKIEEMSKEQESLIDIFSEERDRRSKAEDDLRTKLKEASNTIEELLDKVRLLQKMKSPVCKTER